MSADGDSEVDRLLLEAGAIWREGQPAAREVDPTWFLDAPRPSGIRSVLGAIAALVVVGMVVVIGAFALPRPPESAGLATGPTIPQATPSASGAPPHDSPTPNPPTPTANQPTPTSPPPFDTILEGDAVTATGVLLGSSSGAVTLCPRPISFAIPGSPAVGCAEHTTVEVMGVDVHSFPGRQADDNWVTSYARVNGTWSDGTIVASSAETTEPPQGPGRRTVPCPTPPDGWPGAAPSAAADFPVSRLEATIGDSPDVYSGLWVANIEDTDQTALVVGTVGDVDTGREELAAIYPYNLCVIAVEFSAAELNRAKAELDATGGPWRSSVDARIDRVTVVTAVLDAATVEALAPNADMIRVEVTVEHAH